MDLYNSSYCPFHFRDCHGLGCLIVSIQNSRLVFGWETEGIWTCSTLFWSDPIGESEPVLGCSFNSFYLLFIYLFFFFKSVATQIPSQTRMADPNRSPVYSDRFHLSYQNILFMSFNFRAFSYAEAFQMIGPYTFTFI